MSNDSQRRREIKRLFAIRERQGHSFQALSDRSGIPIGTLQCDPPQFGGQLSHAAIVAVRCQ